MAKTITFNTNRAYTVWGQRITATLHDDGVVTFWDHDRHIDGEFRMPLHCQLNRVEVMHHYDAGTYTSTTRSYRDGMMADGCNASHNLKQGA